MAWNYVPPGEYTAGYWVDNSTPGYPLVSYTDPTQGFDNRNAALESLYIPTAGGRMDQVASLIAQKPEEYAKYGITPQNAADTVNSTFYDRINNIDNDPLNFLNNLAFLPHAMGLANIFTGGGVDSFLNNTFGSGSGPVASGGNPEMVAGWEWSADPRFTGTTVDGVLQNSGNPNWWQTDWGTEGLVDLGTNTGGVSASSLGGTAASAAASALGGSGGSAGGGSLTGALGNAAGAGSALSRILDGTATTSDWLSLGGTAGSTLLGLMGSQQQTQAYKDLAQKYIDFGAPSRARYEAAMTPGFDITSIPGYKDALDTTSESILRKLSATGGNPFGNPGGLIEANKAIVSGTAMPALNEYARLNANTGFGSSMNAAVPFQTAAIGSDANGLNALGAGLASLTTPKNSLQDLLKQIQGQNQGLSLV